MISDPFLQVLPDILNAPPPEVVLTRQDFEELYGLLKPLENNPPNNAEDILREWCMERDSLCEALMDKARKIGGAKSSSGKPSGAGNYFQDLRKIVKNRLNTPAPKNPNAF